MSMLSTAHRGDVLMRETNLATSRGRVKLCELIFLTGQEESGSTEVQTTGRSQVLSGW